MSKQKPENPEVAYGYPVVRYLLVSVVLVLLLTSLGLFSIQELIGFFDRANRQVMTYPPSGQPQKAAVPADTLMVYLLSENGKLSAQDYSARKLDSDYARGRFILDQLKKQSIGNFPKSPFPSMADFSSIHFLEDIILVDLSIDSVAAFADSVEQEMLAIFSVTNSLLGNLDGYTGVQFLVNGKPADTLGSIDLQKPLGENLSLIQ